MTTKFGEGGSFGIEDDDDVDDIDAPFRVSLEKPTWGWLQQDEYQLVWSLEKFL